MSENRSAYSPALELAERAAEKGQRRIVRFARRWAPSIVWGHLLGGGGLVTAAMIAAISGHLRFVVVVGFAAFAISAVVALVGGQSVMRGEQLRRAHAEIRQGRLREQILELQDALDAIELYASGDAEGRRALVDDHKARRLLTPLVNLERRAAAAASAARADRPKPASAARRSASPLHAPKPADTAKIKRRRTERARDLGELRAEIQALAADDDKGVQRVLQETRTEAKALRERAWEADKMVRERLRRGLPPLPNDPGPSHGLDLTIRPLDDVTVRSSVRPSPEMVANGESLEEERA